jgi:hypothetical protein
MDLEWVTIFNQNLEGFWKVFPAPIPNPSELILKISYDVDWDVWEEHSQWHKSYGRIRLVYDEFNLLVSPSESFYPKIEEEVRVIKLSSNLPVLKIGVRKYSFNRTATLGDQTLLPWGVEISSLLV